MLCGGQHCICLHQSNICIPRFIWLCNNQSEYIPIAVLIIEPIVKFENCVNKLYQNKKGHSFNDFATDPLLGSLLP